MSYCIVSQQPARHLQARAAPGVCSAGLGFLTCRAAAPKSATPSSGHGAVHRPARALVASATPRAAVAASTAAAPTAQLDMVDMKTGLAQMRRGVKQAANETIMSPRFYTTDFDEMKRLFSSEYNDNLNADEMEALLQEFKQDYNQEHFVRNKSFAAAAETIEDPDKRRVFVEFLERSCTAEFSGFLLYKELGRRLRDTNPTVAEIFALMSRDEARHAGFLNKALTDFNLALDLGFLTKTRQYTFFKPKFIFYATYLSEKIGYWRYISIYRHLQQNPDKQLYPLFQYFENWCQDENRHGDFIAALLKAQPEYLKDWRAQLWSRFFCLSVYVTMYINDHSRSDFYEMLGLNTTEFNMHVLHQTNRTTALLFPAVIDTYNPEFKRRLDALVTLNAELSSISDSTDPAILKNMKKALIMPQFAQHLLGLFFMKPLEGGSFDITRPDSRASLDTV